MNGMVKKTVIFLIAIAEMATAQSNEIEFGRIAEREGLSQFPVYSILQDSKGFLWFGSLDGLNRYDGYNFKVYKSSPTESNSLSDDLILALHEDTFGTIWIGTATGGLNKFNRESGEFKHFPLFDFVVASYEENIPIVEAPIPYSLLVNKSITKIYEDSRGFLWIGTWGGRILIFDKQKEEFLAYNHPNADDSMLYKSPIMEIYKDTNDALWIGTFGGGLFRHGYLSDAANFSGNGSIFQHYKHDPWIPNSLANDRVVTVLEAQPGILFVATFGGGLSVLNTITGEFHNYEYHEKNPAGISGNYLVSLFRDSVGDIWIGSFGNGLSRILDPKQDLATSENGRDKLDYKNLEFIHYGREDVNPKSLSDNSILAIYEDRGGVLWFGAHRGGVNKFVRRRNQFMHYSHNPYDSNSLNDRTVMAFAQDRDGNLWIGTYYGGLNKFDREYNKFKHFQNDKANPNSLSHNKVRSLHVDEDNILWIGTRNGGLNKFDIATEAFTHYRYDPDNPNSILNNQIIPICEDANGFLWIGVFGSGLCKFDKKSEIFTRYIPDPLNPNSLSGKRVYALLDDRNGKLWVGTYGDGLNEFDKETGVFQHYRHDRSDSTSLSDDHILSLHEDRTGTLWVGTFGGGLCRFERETGTFKNYTQKDGLPGDAILGILDDRAGNIWISTGNGLACLSPETGIINTYDVYDGLQSNVFNAGAAFRSTEGEMFFGGVNGFNRFSPENIKRSEYLPPIVVTDFKKFNEPVKGDYKHIFLTPDENFFTIEFAG